MSESREQAPRTERPSDSEQTVFIDDAAENTHPGVDTPEVGVQLLHEAVQCQLLERRAQDFENDGDPEAAGRLWAEIARLSHRTAEGEAARTALERAMKLAGRSAPVLEACLVEAVRGALWPQVARILEARADMSATETEQSDWLALLAAVREHRLEDSSGAVEAARAAIEKAPANAIARWLLLRGGSATGSGTTDLAPILEGGSAESRGELLAIAAVTAEGAGDSETARRLYAEAASQGSMFARELAARLDARCGKPPESSDGAPSPLLGACARAADPSSRADVERLLAREPTHPAALATAHLLLSRDGDYAKLAGILEQQIAGATAHAERASLLFTLGELYAGPLDRPDDAVRTFNQAVETDPSYTPAVAALARHLRIARKPAALLAVARREVELAPDSRRRASALCRVGTLLKDFDPPRTDEAIEAFQQARALSPDLIAPFVALERILTISERWRDLGELYESELDRVSEIKWRTALLERMAAVWEDRVNDVSCAILAYQRLLEINPDHTGALLGLSRLYGRTGEWEDLMEVLERLAVLEPEGDRNLSILQAACEIAEEQLRDPDRAIALYRKAGARAPAEHPIVAALGRLLDSRGKWQELAELYERQIAGVPPERAVLWNVRLAQLLDQQLARPEDAAARARAALAADPNYRAAQDLLERILIRQGCWEELCAELERQRARVTLPEVRATLLRRIGSILELHLGRHSDAADRFREAMNDGLSSPDLRAALRRCLASAGRWDDLMDALSADVNASTGAERLVLLQDLASLAALPGADPRKALNALRELSAATPNDAVVLAWVGRLEATLGMWTACAGTLRRLAEATTDDCLRAGVLFDLATLSDHRLHRPDAAAAALRRLVLLRPDDRATRLTLERAIDRARNREELCAELRARVDSAAEGSEQRAARLALADALAALGRYPQALSELEQVLSEAPDDLVALTRREALLSASPANAQVFAEALERTARSLGDGEASHDWLRRAARAYVEADNADAALRTLGKLVGSDATDSEGLELMAELLAKRSDWEGVARTLHQAEAAAQSRPKAAEIACRLGEVMRDRLGDLKGAVRAFTRALVGGPPDPKILHALADLNVGLEQWNEAFALYRELARSATDMPVRKESLRKLHEAHSRIGEQREGLAVLRELVAVDPKDPASVEELLGATTAMGLWEEATGLCEQLIELPATPESQARHLVRLAELRERKGDAAAAEDCVRRAAALAPEAAGVLDRYDRVCTEAGEWKELADAYERAISRAAEETGACASSRHLRLAAIREERLGDSAGVLVHLRKAAELDPTSIAARERLAPALERAGELDNAVACYRDLCAAEPGRIEPYRALARLASARADEDSSFVAASALVALDAADETETYFHRQFRPRLKTCPSGELDDVAAMLVDDPTDPAELGVLMHALRLAIDRVLPPAIEEYGLGTDDAIPADSRLMIRRSADQVAKFLGSPRFKLYVWPTTGMRVTVEPTPVPSLIVSQQACEAPPRDLLFALGRAMTRIVRATVPFDPGRLMPVSAVELTALIAAARRSVGATADVRPKLEPVVADLALRLKPELDEKARAAVSASVANLPQNLDASAALEAMEKSASRIGLVICGDMASAAAHMRRQREVEPDVVRKRIEQLCAFWVSARAYELRRRFGYAIS